MKTTGEPGLGLIWESSQNNYVLFLLSLTSKDVPGNSWMDVPRHLYFIGVS